MASLQQRAEKLVARATSSRAQSWRPDSNEDAPNPLVGFVTGLTTVDNEYGLHKVIKVKDAETNIEWSVWATRAALKEAIQRDDPQVGQGIYIKYGGLETSKKSGRQYHAYKVTVEDPQESAFELPEDEPDNIPF